MKSTNFTIDAIIGEYANSNTDKDEANGTTNLDNGLPLHPLLKEVEMRLDMSELWRTFSQLDTEMIVTKSGRRMFPTIQVSVRGLDAQSMYTMAVDFEAFDCKRYRYSFHQSCWVVAGPGDPESPPRQHVHTESPAIGAHWMRQSINFDKLKLTNNQLDTNGYIILNSMHRYQPRIRVSLMAEHLPNLHDSFRLERIFVFPETKFMAVTAYQNHRITQLKIASNPFAKGFRDSDTDEWFYGALPFLFTGTPASNSIWLTPNPNLWMIPNMERGQNFMPTQTQEFQRQSESGSDEKQDAISKKSSKRIHQSVHPYNR